MAEFQDLSMYVSELSMSFDEARGLYIGEFFSLGELYRIEGHDRESLEREMESLVYAEYEAMQREVSYGFSRSVDEPSGRSRGGSGGERKGRGLFDNWADYVSAPFAFGVSPALKAGLEIARGTIREWSESVASLWGVNVKRKIFAVSFGGVVITAASRRKLKKKLLLQRNRRIQMIMLNVRTSEKERRKILVANNALMRLKIKKKYAELVRPKLWALRVAADSPQGQQTGWRGRVVGLRDDVSSKRVRAECSWYE